ncbi:DUF3221 domain-containing protein [Bacillus salitolerans]|uniref:DUF3221 domain-containing protein n=1 Tax=Bacillus salitolerans TaxID=1437434 RepID=A0ABW4LN19_9BACI
MKKHIKLSLICLISIIILTSCSQEDTITGYVSSTITDQNYFLLIQNITQDEIRDKTFEEKVVIAIEELENEDSNGYFIYVPQEFHDKVILGEKVKVWLTGPAQESLPPKVSAEKIQTISN